MLNCTVTGDYSSADAVEWFKNGIRLSSDNSANVSISTLYSISKRLLSSILVIDIATMLDSGRYTCRLLNMQAKSVSVVVLSSK